MTAERIDGRLRAKELDSRVTEGVSAFSEKVGRVPGLAAVLVGTDAASQIYVRNKVKRTKSVGMLSFEHVLPETTTESDLLSLVDDLNADPRVDGILVQLPLPGQIRAERVTSAVSPEKDVDGFHIVNVGAVASGVGGLVPCTPLGCLILAAPFFGGDFAGVESVVVGRSNIVGRPMANLLLARRATVTVVHSATRDVASHVRGADLVVVAAGSAGLVRGDWVGEGAVVIDVGINRLADGKVVGDVNFEEVSGVARALTPVPGGVGPMTIGCLLLNTLTAALRREGLGDPDIGLGI
ncbi:MAG: bifunctional methylenetetrahydrofolate dehydrogenase/methenyltetrahydrofolate cyclohydrolase [Alphaproteobacteria bacterium]|nr:bifunctional methylenetetrahydrofolate dehydrogenase/methenyltetrahydrofolate cyclohydrolase [Alphaproteobacteria bacterium]MDA7988274.1 bifunctional methylenetetrahydrofolate dehydrogenase/methenyltetrahydrofolate cyclohydrolase [Alphaproteobacteria bacterium]MDA8000480.1 bifunctional methylenetetrahydrofolate dehydrogenase/methenyltetrahydrofolate cyclohydrolase [Alphaproteobacteria bacterium]MDA8004463.1 bifunctional methylenetetrahydrofolate dehydrogenase/methenyltetrahydrofolate cyclohyd